MSKSDRTIAPSYWVEPGRRLASEYPGELLDNLLTATDEETAEQPREGLILTNEAGLRRVDPHWELVESTVRAVDPGLGNSYCCLADQSGSYIQTLRGLNGFHLERRLYNGAGPDDYEHLRGCYPGASNRPQRLFKCDEFVNAGEQRDLLYCDDVVDAFRAFYRGRMSGGWLEWRLLDL